MSYSREIWQGDVPVKRSRSQQLLAQRRRAARLDTIKRHWRGWLAAFAAGFALALMLTRCADAAAFECAPGCTDAVLAVAAQGGDPQLAAQATLIAVARGIDPLDMLAVLMVESGCNQYESDGGLKHGDRGRAIGAGQIHRSPWQRHFSVELERPVDLDLPADNLECCARLLLRGGYSEDRLTAFGYYNSGEHTRIRRYERRVLAARAALENSPGISP